MPDQHALLSASGAHRWLNCPLSAVLESREPAPSSAAAEQGTVAHALAEWKLRRALHQAPGFKPESTWIDTEMEDLTDDYVAFVQEHVSLAQETCGDPQVLIEQRLDFSHVVPGGFGTGGCVIIAEPTLQIIDLKYGQGVLVRYIPGRTKFLPWAVIAAFEPGMHDGVELRSLTARMVDGTSHMVPIFYRTDGQRDFSPRQSRLKAPATWAPT